MARKHIANTSYIHTVYTSPDGRVRIDVAGDRYYRSFALYLDGSYHASYERQHEAEVAAGLWLHEQAEALSVYQGRA